MEILIRAIQGEPPQSDLVLPHEVILRESTGQ